MQLTKLSAQQVQTLINEKRATGLAADSVARIRDVLRDALNQAMAWNLVTRNAAARVKAPRGEYQERHALTPAQARRFLDATQQHRLAALFSVALSLGLRQGEVLGLTWDDVDLERGTLTVRRQVQRVDGVFQFVEAKSAQSRRVIDLPASLVPTLKYHRQEQLAARLATGPAWHDWNLVFCTSSGAPFDEGNITRYCKRALADAGLPALTFHELRHSCASLLAAQGIPAHEIARLLGHSDVRLTLQRYTHAFDEGRRRVADAMNQIISPDDAHWRVKG